MMTTIRRMAGANGRLGIRAAPHKGTVSLYDAANNEVTFQVTHLDTLRDLRRGEASSNEVDFRFRTFVRELEALLDRNGIERFATEEKN